MDGESIDVAPSEDNGNVAPEDILTAPSTPSAPQDDVTPQADPVVDPVTTPQPELFELPDGRKVDGETLSKEWKENFLPEFTRKSQALSEIEKSKEIKQATEDKPYQDPDWAPKTYAELIEIAKQEVKGDLDAQQRAAAEARQALESSVVQQLNEIKKIDPTLNENALFLHANEYREKYGVSFPDLKSAHQHMKDVQSLTKTVQQNTVKNIAKRADPVSAAPGATGAGVDPGLFGNAIEYLRSLKA